jgi:hypothetical protein
MLDEGLEILTGLWTGEPFTFQGKQFQIRDALFLPTPIQSPRIPIWVAGVWPNKRPLRRAARWDGVIPLYAEGASFKMITPDVLREIVGYVAAHRDGDGPFDVVIGGPLPEDPGRAAEIVAPYAEAGLTWWQVGVPGLLTPLDEARARIRRGPPRYE